MIDIEADGHSDSDDTIAYLDEDDDAGIFSIANEYTSEDECTFAEEDDLLAVRTGRTVSNKRESAETSLLEREAVVRFVQDSIAKAVDKQKQNADKHGRANVLLFNVGDLVLLSTVNLPKHVVTNVGTSKLLPKYIGPFRIIHRKGNAYTIELPRRMRTHPTFYVGRLRPYYQYEASSAGEYIRHAQEPPRGSLVPAPSHRSALVRQMLRTNGSNLVAKSLTLPLVFQLLERPLRTIVRSLEADALHIIIQRETFMSLLLDAVSQTAHSIMATIEISLQHSQSNRS